MTVAATARGAARRHLLWVLLTLSLVLNLCFVAGALWSRFHAPPPPFNLEGRFQQMAAELALDPPQKEAFERYAQTIRAHIRQMRETVQPLIADAWSETAKPDADETKVMALFGEAAEKRRSFQRELMTTTLSFLATLSPEQRATFVEIARQRPRHWGPPPHHDASR